MSAANSSTQLEKRAKNAVDPVEQPSAEWGWHGSFPRGREIGGWFTVVAFAVMAFVGNHVAETERLWLLGITALLVIVLIGERVRRRTSWRR
ncbi:DUF2631 domain-containing protein [Actinophytocola oryzae]|uniref:Uncharacterized protein DUF2631 n=1 Tax=Actinophytocola oryzae TaxID=502181 RepID=A0A4R7UXD3_9PSEU|nr:DUF2631 domain-containing protein [Actinophytocola oryzae]TDV39726.1 uncharacterized protein DUF2631 [Actinophytocola oryzae]